jgi:hypothetical protein
VEHIDLGIAHGASIRHREQIMASTWCKCFHCLAQFRPHEIQEWLDEDSAGSGQTAVCPHCGIDSVLGSASGLPLTPEFLEAMRRRWF